jgi:glycosyltransferase involved in cell wall biosynthesis
MLCSIIIPLYNKADYIGAAIQSVLDQTHQNFEILVVDDGSTDNGVSRVKAIFDKRIKLIQQANSGVSCARNKGIECAIGDIICFLDADDWYLPAYLATIVSISLRYPEIGYFATYYKCVRSTNQSIESWNPGDTGTFEVVDNLFYRWRFGTLFVTNSVAIRRSFLAQFKPYFAPGEQWLEDHDLWFRLSEKSSLAYCPAPLVGYRMAVAGSLCATYKPQPLLPVYTRLEQRALNGQMPSNLRNSALRLVAEAKITVIRNELAGGRRYQAFKQLMNAWRGMVSRRWWVSLFMCLAVPPDLVSRWDGWRKQRVRNW